MSDFAEANVIKRGEHKYDVNYGTDKGLFVEFDTMPELQEFASTEAGRPIYKDIEIVRIYKPGVNQPTIRKVQATASSTTPSDYDRWPQAYAAFKNKAVIVHEGTTLESWPPLTKSDVLNFKAANIHTVEQLAEVPDTALDGHCVSRCGRRQECNRFEAGQANRKPDGRHRGPEKPACRFGKRT